MSTSRQEESVTRLSSRLFAQRTMSMQDDPERTARHVIDRLDKNMKLSQAQDRALEVKEDSSSMLEDAPETAKCFEAGHRGSRADDGLEKGLCE